MAQRASIPLGALVEKVNLVITRDDGLQGRLTSVAGAERVSAVIREAEISDEWPGQGMFCEKVEGGARMGSKFSIRERLAIVRREVYDCWRAHELVESGVLYGERRAECGRVAIHAIVEGRDLETFGTHSVRV